MRIPVYITNDDRCVMCGAVVPEGRMVCWACEVRILEKSQTDSAEKPTRRSVKAHPN
ncbi:MAG: hypothetical protein ACI3W5_03620 [Faecousia sp.]